MAAGGDRARRITASVACAVLWTAAACSSGGRGGSARAPDVIAVEEIARYRDEGTRDLRELIQRARPRWLETRGERSINLETTVLVYQNNQVLGSLEVLRDIPILNVVAIRYLDASRAGLLPGARSQHVAAAIVVETKGEIRR
ncbi:MAG: hypothetical protein ACREMQ_24250 [Longimicrobiales bacterium]